MSPKLSNIIIRADTESRYEERKKIVEAALEAGYMDIIIKKGDEKLARLARYNTIVKDGERLTLFGDEIGTFMKIDSVDAINKAYAISSEYVVVEIPDSKIIPLENLISRFQKTETKLYSCVETPEKAKLALETMEVGCDGVVFCPKTSADIRSFSHAFESAFSNTSSNVSSNASSNELRLFGNALCTNNFSDRRVVHAVITKIEPLALGDRVCIDTSSILEKGEGMFIGSSSSCLFLVCSESFESEYVAARPFRVNAGAVHSYILCPDGTTRYLSEIEAGTQLLTRLPSGALRTVDTGRVKIERRPMLLIEAEAGVEIEAEARGEDEAEAEIEVTMGNMLDSESKSACVRHSIVLQNAETIRLGTPTGAKSVSDLNVGDTVLVRVETGGRHFGHAIEETILEK